MKVPPYLLALFVLMGLFASAKKAQAQTYQPSNRVPIADSTLGTTVIRNADNFAITGGLSRGQNTFHSFQDFSVPTNGAATFANPVGNQSIITRVTGNLFSDINGTINTQGANFLLINPNGVVFGPGTQLNVGRVFAASTANGVDLVDGAGRTLSFGTNTSGDGALLSIDPKVIFNVSRLNLGGGNGEIKNFGTLQTNNPNQYIGLLGGNVSLDGGNIEAPGGRVELGGLSTVGSVLVGVEGGSPRLSFLENVDRANVSLSNQARVNVAGAGGGDINLDAHDLKMSDGSIIRGGIERNSGTVGVIAGNINVLATGKVSLNSGSLIANSVREKSIGTGGDTNVIADHITLDGNSGIGNSNFGNGNSGNVIIQANNTAFFNNNSYIVSGIGSSAIGNSGDISVTANTIFLQNSSTLSTINSGKGVPGNLIVKARDKISLTDSSGLGTTVSETSIGKSGDISIETNYIDLNSSSFLSSSNFGKGDTGKIIVTAKDKVSLSNSFISSDIFLGGFGKGGDISVDSSSTSLNNSTISSSTGGIGDAGKISLQSSGIITLDKNSSIKSVVYQGAAGNGNDITVRTGSLFLQNGSVITSTTGGDGKAGNLVIAATDRISLNGKGVAIISTVAEGVRGRSGEINISSDTLSINDQAGISSSNFGTGNAGNINFKVIGELIITGNEKTAGISSFGGDKGNGGNIVLKVGFLTLKDNALISSAGIKSGGSSGNIDIVSENDILLSNKATIATTAFGGGDSGIINLSAKNATLLEKSTIISTLIAGKGNAGDIIFNITDSLNMSDSIIQSNTSKNTEGNSGNSTINTRDLNILDNSIIATSGLGKGNAGDININARNNLNVFNSSVLSNISEGAEGNGGTNKINTGILNVQGKSVILTSINGKGNAGNIQINARESIFITDGSRVSSTIEEKGIGQGGNISLNSNIFFLQDSVMSATSLGKGNAGSVDIKASDATIITKSILGSPTGIFVTSQGSSGIAGDVFISSPKILLTSAGISASSITGANGGNIRIADANLIFLRQGGFIAASVGGENSADGNGGNVNISSKIIAAIPKENNDITANAVKGSGGNIGIISQGLLGIQPSSQQTSNSDITASSTFGQSGNININTPGIDPGKDTSKLPIRPIDASKQITQRCSATQEDNQFYVTGRGGHPSNTSELLNNDVVWLDPRNPRTQSIAINSIIQQARKTPQPAVGWAFNGKGKVTLLSPNHDQSILMSKVACPTIQKLPSNGFY
jgi:filamentous hemagglutinin family protein